MERELSSPAGRRRQMIARLAPKPLTSMQQAMAAIERQYKQMSPTLHAIAELARKESAVAERILGTPRPVQPQRKRKPGAGRPPVLTQAQIADGIALLPNSGYLPPKDANRILRDAGINASDSTLLQIIIKPARQRLRGPGVKNCSRSQ